MMDANEVKGHAESHEYDTKDRQGTPEPNKEKFYRSQQKRRIRMWREKNKRKKKDINFKRKWLIEKCSDSEDLILIQL